MHDRHLHKMIDENIKLHKLGDVTLLEIGDEEFPISGFELKYSENGKTEMNVKIEGNFNVGAIELSAAEKAARVSKNYPMEKSREHPAIQRRVVDEMVEERIEGGKQIEMLFHELGNKVINVLDKGNALLASISSTDVVTHDGTKVHVVEEELNG